ncbi:MAG: histidinol-phosphatase HisJ family protein [Anaerolineales bacterium]|nr:histidinol-phosphatase HisJ family protein [Anaerolineales bacterium]
MLIDCHVHSTISSDARSPIAEMCRAAIRKGGGIVCFTEHLDLNPADANFGYYNHEKYAAEIAGARAAFGDKIEILQGIEFSEPHVYPRDFERMVKKNFDFVLGSVHAFRGTWAGAEDILQKYSNEEIYHMHYSETLKMVQFGGFDSLAHMDFPRRFLPEHKEPPDLIDPIFSALIKAGIALELNSAPLNRGKDFSLPSPTLLRRYQDLGGRYVTMGSDAHHADEICMGMDALTAQIESHRFEAVVYRGRKRFPAGIGAGGLEKGGRDAAGIPNDGFSQEL